ncbi:MAG: 50S ribosomal protein L25 [Thermoleophilaceae bacterium]
MADEDRPSLSVDERPERGSREARRLRRSGFVPGVLYGQTHPEPVSFKVGQHELRRLLVGGAALFDVKIGGEKAVPVILKDRQDHPVRGETMHVDFLEVNLREKIHSTVSVELEGAEESPGVSEGGVVEHVTRELNIEALPTDIPDVITVDVSGLEVNATLMLSEVPVPEGVEFLDDPEETTIATVVVPTEVEEPEIEVETELIGETGEAPQAEGESAGDAADGDSGGDSGDSE